MSMHGDTDGFGRDSIATPKRAAADRRPLPVATQQQQQPKPMRDPPRAPKERLIASKRNKQTRISERLFQRSTMPVQEKRKSIIARYSGVHHPSFRNDDDEVGRSMDMTASFALDDPHAEEGRRIFSSAERQPWNKIRIEDSNIQDYQQSMMQKKLVIRKFEEAQDNTRDAQFLGEQQQRFGTYQGTLGKPTRNIRTAGFEDRPSSNSSNSLTRSKSAQSIRPQRISQRLSSSFAQNEVDVSLKNEYQLKPERVVKACIDRNDTDFVSSNVQDLQTLWPSELEQHRQLYSMLRRSLYWNKDLPKPKTKITYEQSLLKESSDFNMSSVDVMSKRQRALATRKHSLPPVLGESLPPRSQQGTPLPLYVQEKDALPTVGAEEKFMRLSQNVERAKRSEALWHLHSTSAKKRQAQYEQQSTIPGKRCHGYEHLKVTQVGFS